MGLLVGLPLKIFYMLFTILRFAWPLLILLAVTLIRRRLRAGGRTWTRPAGDKPDFDGPVVEVDYEVVDDKEE
jgi:hypothetical protein